MSSTDKKELIDSRSHQKTGGDGELYSISSELIRMRSETIDWLVIVCEKLSQSCQTFFLSVQLLDKVIKFYQYQTSPEDLYLICVACFFIASKFEEPKPISLKVVLNNVAHGKYSKEEFLCAEKLILKVINFKIPRSDFIDILHSLVYRIDNKDLSKEDIFKYTISLCKLTVLDLKKLSLLTSKTFLAALVGKAMNKFQNKRTYKNSLDETLGCPLFDKFDKTRIIKIVGKIELSLKKLKGKDCSTHHNMKEVEFSKYEM